MRLIANMNEQQIREIIKDELSYLIKNDRYKFDYPIEMGENKDVRFGTNTGTKIGTTTAQKFAFWGATPVDRPATVNDPAGGLTVDSEARTAINAIIDRLQELGLIS